MEPDKSLFGVIMIAAGLVLSIAGMVTYTGLSDWAVPSAVMYVGYAMSILGIALVMLDFRDNAGLVGRYLGNGEKESGKKSSERTVRVSPKRTRNDSKKGKK